MDGIEHDDAVYLQPGALYQTHHSRTAGLTRSRPLRPPVLSASYGPPHRWATSSQWHKRGTQRQLHHHPSQQTTVRWHNHVNLQIQMRMKKLYPQQLLRSLILSAQRRMLWQLRPTRQPCQGPGLPAPALNMMMRRKFALQWPLQKSSPQPHPPN